jgi:hypothetical protein
MYLGIGRIEITLDNQEIPKIITKHFSYKKKHQKNQPKYSKLTADYRINIPTKSFGIYHWHWHYVSRFWHSHCQRLISDRNKPSIKKDDTIMAQSSTATVVVPFIHGCYEIASWVWLQVRGRGVVKGGEIRKRKKESRIRKTYFEYALTIWEPSIGRADAHIHDKVVSYTTMFLKRKDE